MIAREKPQSKKRRKPARRYTPPPSRSDAAQRTGAKPVRRRVPAPKPYSPPASFKPEAATRRFTPAQRKETRKIERQEVAARRRRDFPKDPIKGMRRSQRRALIELSNLRAQDPEKYKRRQRSGLSNTVRDIGGGADKALRGATEAIKRQVDKASDDRFSRAGLGAKPAPGKELLDIAANLPSSVYLTGAAVKEAAEGRPQRAKKLYKDFKDTSAISPLVSGNLKEAGKRAAERPITTGLELWGAKAVVGRGAGAAARRAPVPGKGFRAKVRKVGSTERENLRLYPDRPKGEGPEEGRRYSKDLINKGVQVAIERRTRKGSRVRKDGTQRRPGRDPNIERGAQLVPALPRRMGGASARAGAPVRSKLVRRGDTRYFAQERTSTHRAQKAEKEAKRIVPRKEREATTLQLITEAVARSHNLRADLNKHKLALALEYKRMVASGADPERIRLNRKLRKDIREMLARPDADLQRLVGGAQRYADSQKAVQRRGVKVGRWDDVAQSKRFFPAIQSHYRHTKSQERFKGVPEDAGIQRILERRVRRGKAIPERIAREAAARAATRIKPDNVAVVMRKGPDPRTVSVAVRRRGIQLPVVIRELPKHRRGDPRKGGMVRGGYGGIRMDRQGGMRSHVIYINPEQGIGAMNSALWHELGHAADVEGGRKFNPTTQLDRAAYDALESERIANAFQRRHEDLDLTAPPVVSELVSRNPRPGQPKLLKQSDFTESLAGVRRRRTLPVRPIDEENLAIAARVAERRHRRGKTTFTGIPEGGPAFVTQRPASATARNRGAMFAGPGKPSSVREGVAFATGARPTGREQLIHQAITAERQVTATEGWRLLEKEFGYPASERSAYAKTAEDAASFGRRLTHDPETGELIPGKVPLVPVEVGRNRWGLMPEDIVDRMAAHAGVERIGPLHNATNLFKDVVLTSSSPARWIGGNVTDIGMRTLFAGITPMDIMRGRRIVRRAAQRGLQGEQAASAVSGGGLYHASEALSRSMGTRVGENPARTVLSAPWRAWKGGVYSLEHFIEELPQWGAVGKSMRQETGRALGLPTDQLRASILENGGITINLRGKQPKSGHSVAQHPERERVIKATDLTDADIQNYVAMNRDLLSQPGKHVGAWVDGGNVHFDIVSVVKDRAKALQVAKDNGQEAIFDLGSFAEIPTGLPAAARGPVKSLRSERPTPAQRVADAKQRADVKALLRMHDQQIDNYANRLATDRALEARLQKTTEDVIGRWGKVSPTMRRALVIAPFAQWLGAATRYVFVTLPVHHPIKTSLLAGISEMTEEERKALGLSYHLPRDKQVQDYQMGTIPTKVGENEYGPVVEGVRTARMTSFGTAAGVPGNIGEFLLPQFAGPLDAWTGTSFTNEMLVYPDWWPEVEKRRLPLPPDERFKIGLGALMEATVPFASAFRRSILEKGRPAEPYSTILTPALRRQWDAEDKEYKLNEGTRMGGILEWLAPFAPESRLYTYGAGKAIEEAGITGETLEKWRKQPRPAKGKYGFGGGSTVLPSKDAGFGNRGLSERESKFGF